MARWRRACRRSHLGGHPLAPPGEGRSNASTILRPPRLLIADEVGLGKTIQAGMLLRQAWHSKRVGRVLILAPKAILRQWQVELREKFNLNWPIYDGRKLVWYPSPAWRGRNERRVDRHAWHRQPVVIASSQMMRRRDRAAVLLEEAAPLGPDRA